MTRLHANRYRASSGNGTLLSMDDVVYMVRGATQETCQLELDRLCELLGARPTMRPSDSTGRGWVARAVPTPPHDEPAGR